MVPLIEQVAEKLKALPSEQQQEVLHFVEFLETKLSHSQTAPQIIREPRISLEEAIEKYAGCVEGRPSDLSTNKAYMEGFGEV